MHDLVVVIVLLLLLVAPPVVDEAAKETEEDDGEYGHRHADVCDGHTVRGAARGKRPYRLVVGGCLPAPVAAVSVTALHLGIGVPVLPSDVECDPRTGDIGSVRHHVMSPGQ